METKETLELCHVCKLKPYVSVWGMGTKRCQPCTDDWNQQIRQKRQAERDAAECEICQVKTGGPDICQECCSENGHERDPDEGMMCLNCNAEWDGP